MKVMTRTLMGPGLVLFGCVAGAQEAPPKQMALDIEPQPMVDALNGWAQQTGLQLIVPDADATNRLAAPRLKGQFTAQAALSHLLAGTPLMYEFVNERTVAIHERLPASMSASNPAAGEQVHLRLAAAQTDEARRSSDSGATNSPSSSAKAREPNSKTYPLSDLEEIIVTAQKRSERLQDVPVPVTAIRAELLVESNLLRIEDYYTRIPGLGSAPGIQGSNLLSIRGITTAGANPTVGVMIDDVPYGASMGLGGGFVVPDIDPSELARVEVLRGPQGTLYGASSMGGLFKYVTVDPSAEAMSGQLQAGLSSVRNGNESGYNVRGSVNVPLSDTFAVRASGFTRRDPGYVDDPALGIEGANTAEVVGGRLSGMWRPSETLSLKLSALVQDSEADGSGDMFPGLGDLKQAYGLPGMGAYDRKNQAYSATLNAKLGQADFTALSGYNTIDMESSVDFTHIFGSPTPYADSLETTKFTQELRMVLPLGEKVEWLVGAFYTDEDSTWIQKILTADRTTEQIRLAFPTTFEEYAAFSSLTFHVTDRFDLQLGGRQSENRQTYSEVRTGSFFATPVVVPERRSKDDAFTYLITPRFKISPDLMVYARLASGYRPGGPNTAPIPNVSPTYDSDTTENYEIGIKGSVLDRMLSFDASVYYTDWKDFQIVLVTPSGGYNGNGSRATSQGVELSLELEPTAGTSIAAWAAWGEAELAEDLPTTSSAFGRTGERLPFSSRVSGNLSVDQEFALGSALTGFAGVSVSYVGDRDSYFRGGPTGERQNFPSYVKTDLHAGIRYDDWAVNLFVNNVADKRGALAGGTGAFIPNSFTYIQPRTAGVFIVKTF